MKNPTHSLKVTSAWVSILYVICYVGVAVYPPIRDLTLKYALHLELPMRSGPFDLGVFFAGLIIWNVIALLAVWLFLFLDDAIKG
jgi:hypothetical protein